MSKVDAQRAMREARYARLRASGPTRREAAAAAAGDRPPVAPAAPPSAPPGPVDEAVPATTAPQAGLCGHRSINGRGCTRAAGHAEKNHRYS